MTGARGTASKANMWQVGGTAGQCLLRWRMQPPLFVSHCSAIKLGLPG